MYDQMKQLEGKSIMPETITRQLREPFVEAAGLGITNQGLKLLGGSSIPTWYIYR